MTVYLLRDAGVILVTIALRPNRDFFTECTLICASDPNPNVSH
jgi:hypothetical protein